MGPSLCMLWGLGPHGPKLPQFCQAQVLLGLELAEFMPSSGPLGPRACFCSQSVHGGQWLLRGHFRLSARPSPAEGSRPDSSEKFGFWGFRQFWRPRSFGTGAEVGASYDTTGHLLGLPRRECELHYNSTPLADNCNCTTTALQAVAAGSRGKGISVPLGEQPLPQKRVVLSRTLHTAAPPSAATYGSATPRSQGTLPMPSPRVAYATVELTSILMSPSSRNTAYTSLPMASLPRASPAADARGRDEVAAHP